MIKTIADVNKFYPYKFGRFCSEVAVEQSDVQKELSILDEIEKYVNSVAGFDWSERGLSFDLMFKIKKFVDEILSKNEISVDAANFMKMDFSKYSNHVTLEMKPNPYFQNVSKGIVHYVMGEHLRILETSYKMHPHYLLSQMLKEKVNEATEDEIMEWKRNIKHYESQKEVSQMLQSQEKQREEMKKVREMEEAKIIHQIYSKP